ncbi:hypothetical protein ABEV54_08300 [Peribacillus psychrosaccharolyticus]
MSKPGEIQNNHRIKRHKEQGEYRLKKALSELDGLTESIKESEDTLGQYL